MDKRYIVGFTALVAAMALGIALWLSPWDSPGVTAQEVVETACDKTASALEFDMIVSLDLPGNYAHPLDNERDVWEMKASISGGRLPPDPSFDGDTDIWRGHLCGWSWPTYERVRGRGKEHGQWWT